MLLNYWYNHKVDICCFSYYEWNSHFSMTHWCSNYSIEIIVSINLVNFLDLVHLVAHSFFRKFENKDNPLHMEVVSGVLYELWYFVTFYQIISKQNLVYCFSVNLIMFSGGCKILWVVIKSDIFIQHLCGLL